jgi:hypothetical protein
MRDGILLGRARVCPPRRFKIHVGPPHVQYFARPFGRQESDAPQRPQTQVQRLGDPPKGTQFRIVQDSSTGVFSGRPRHVAHDVSVHEIGADGERAEFTDERMHAVGEDWSATRHDAIEEHAHVALRNLTHRPVLPGGQDLTSQVAAILSPTLFPYLSVAFEVVCCHGRDGGRGAPFTFHRGRVRAVTRLV